MGFVWPEEINTAIKYSDNTIPTASDLHRVDKLKKYKTLDCAAAAKSLQSCPTLCDPIEGSLPGSPVPGILQARTLEWVAISLSSA